MEVAKRRLELDPPLDQGMRVVGDDHQRVGVQERVDPARGVGHALDLAIGSRDRGDLRIGAEAVGVGVVVGQREQQEVAEVVLEEVVADAARVLVAQAGLAERGPAAGVAAGEHVGVEELGRAHDGAPQRHARQPRERRRLGDLVLVAAAVDEEGRARGAHAGVVQDLEDRGRVLREVLAVHRVNEVSELLGDAEPPGRAHRGPVLHVAALVAPEPVHRRDPVHVLARAGGDRGRADRGHGGERRHAVGDECAPLDHLRQHGRLAGFDGAEHHRRLHAVDDREDELHRSTRRPANFSPERRRPPSSSQARKPTATIDSGGASTAATASTSAAASA